MAAAACDGLLPAGALLQTPSTELKDAVKLTINGADLQIAGTIFMASAGSTLNIIALDGVVVLENGGMLQSRPGGRRSQYDIQRSLEGDALRRRRDGSAADQQPAPSFSDYATAGASRA